MCPAPSRCTRVANMGITSAQEPREQATPLQRACKGTVKASNSVSLSRYRVSGQWAAFSINSLSLAGQDCFWWMTIQNSAGW